jgi:hypothetical protein
MCGPARPVLVSSARAKRRRPGIRGDDCEQQLELKMPSGDMALRLSIVFSVAGFIALAAGLYEIDRREKSSSATIAANLMDMEQRVQILTDQIRVLSDQSTAQQVANERRFQALTTQIQALGGR